MKKQHNFSTKKCHRSEYENLGFLYRTRAIIGRSRFEAAFVYKLRILGLKIEEFPFLVHNWFVT